MSILTDGKCRGCLFCKSGKETEVIQRFQSAYPDSRAIFPTFTRYRRSKDSAVEERVPLLPGYVFFELEATWASAGASEASAQRLQDVEDRLLTFSRTANVLKLLRYNDQDWRLHGSDDAFARMLFDAGGNIAVSQAYFDEGDRIRILNGFLKDYEGCVTRVNRKKRMVEVGVDFQEKKMCMWLGYELVEAVKR